MNTENSMAMKLIRRDIIDDKYIEELGKMDRIVREFEMYCEGIKENRRGSDIYDRMLTMVLKKGGMMLRSKYKEDSKKYKELNQRMSAVMGRYLAWLVMNDFNK